MRKILSSILVISAVAAVGFLGTQAYFSDTEESLGNTITAGTIDISVDDENPWERSQAYALEDLKPGGHVEYIDFEVKNVGENPANIWKKIFISSRTTGLESEPECTEQGGDWVHGTPGHCVWGSATDLNDIDAYVNYDMTVDGVVLIPEDWGVTLGDVDDLWVLIGSIEPGEILSVSQSYHLDADVGNEYQGDQLGFDITLYAEQYMGTGPAPTSHGVILENKDLDPHWRPIIDGTWAILTWDGSGNYDLKAWGLDNGSTYRIAYWNGSSEVGVSGPYVAPSGGELSLSGTYPGFNTNPAGAKYWLRPLPWDNAKTLWEANLVN